MDALPYYKWYWIDYRANRKVQRMSWQARGLYRELLDEFWSEGILPLDTTALADICCCDYTSFLMWWPEIEPSWEETADGYLNVKMEEQRTAVDSARAAKARAGAKGGRKSNSFTRSKQVQAEAKQLQAEAERFTDSKQDIALAKQMQAQPDIAEQSRAEQSRAPEAIAKKVQIETGILTDRAYMVMVDVVRREQGMGIPDDIIVDAMVAAWVEYSGAKPHLTFQVGAEKFFGEGAWKEARSWPWAKGEKPKPKKSSSPRVLSSFEQHLAETEGM